AILGLLCLTALGLVATQTRPFKNYLRRLVIRQASEYLNATLYIDRLQGSLLTGLELDGVTLRHENQPSVSIETVTLEYDPIAMIRAGLVLKHLTLDHPTVLLERDSRGWNFNRFVKTSQNSAHGSPPITFETVTINDGRLLVRNGE